MARISTMSVAVKRFDERMKQDTGVAEKVEQLKIGLQVAVIQAPVGSRVKRKYHGKNYIFC